MGVMKTPGVYIVEKNAFPNSVVEVATAVPVFIGYTEFADNKGKPLSNKAWRITSMAEFVSYFGGPPMPSFSLSEPGGGDAATADAGEEGEGAATGGADNATANFSMGINRKTRNFSFFQQKGPKGGKYLLYRSMQLFFQNGGSTCYIVSVGDYSQDVEADKLQAGIKELLKEQEPTMVVIPEAVLLDKDNCISVQQAALAHCGGKMRNRITILDIYDGWKDRNHPDGNCIDEFRNALGINYLDFATAYYPWLNTTIVQDNELGYVNFDEKEELMRLIREELKLPEELDKGSVKEQQQNKAIQSIGYTDEEWQKQIAQDTDKEASDITEDEIEQHKVLLNKSLIAMSPAFNSLLAEMKSQLNLLPPAAAMAGIYTMVDNSRGVWKAPANVSLNAVISPTVNITHDDQEDLNVTTQGKSINAIRPFIGEGTLVWGARTLDGNSLDWRYVNVRRTMIMLEESIRLASKAYVFENNTANTWVTIKSMISNFLTGIWKRGGLAGAAPADAFSVHVGLGDTMTPEDILEGIMRITVLVALIRPAEFIEITFQQQMQKS
ncbi:MAG: phage tail sheath C-terminal domain-containing protein [Candidatus Electrothrix aestuarii]|uniref:Phage tail sheath C-terminal domain-containing protein n=1 Tax=Candidatus Electrothrix aestuarii TaxID=3062594 RepID=A0AAU8LW62_9BACT|nr:phage tail sheath C-terminal domain-containing protein [Candidatus Electrothrix aestuarii]